MRDRRATRCVRTTTNKSLITSAPRIQIIRYECQRFRIPPTISKRTIRIPDEGGWQRRRDSRLVIIIIIIIIIEKSPVGRVGSFRSWSSYLFRGRPGGRHHVWSRGRLSDYVYVELKSHDCRCVVVKSSHMPEYRSASAGQETGQ